MYFYINSMDIINYNTKYSDFRNEFFENKTFTPIKCSDFYPTNNLNTADIPNIPNLPVAMSSMKLSYFKNVRKTLFNISISGTETTIKTIPQPENTYNNYYHLRLLHQGSTNTSLTANYTEYTIRFPYNIVAEVLLVGGGGGGGAGFNNNMYGGGGHPGEYRYTGAFTFNENQIYKIRVGAGGLGMQSSLDTTTIDGTSSIIYDNTNSPLLTALGGKRGNNILYYSQDTFTSISNITTNITITTSVTNILIPLRATNIIYNYTDTIINNMPTDFYNVTFTNGSINVGTLPSNKSYPILKTGSTILSPLLWYKFDNSLINSGSLGNLYDIIDLYGNTLAFNTSYYIKGLSSLYLAKSNTYAFGTIPNGTLNFNDINTANGISFSLWIYTFSSTGNNTIFYFGTLSGTSFTGIKSRNITLVKTKLNIFIARIDTTSVDGSIDISRTNFSINETIPDSSWVHLVWTITSAGIWTIYINKTLINTGITLQIPQFTHTNKYYYIGKFLSNDQAKFDGLIDDFRIYDFPLTQSQVNELYNGRVDISSYTSDVFIIKEFTCTNNIQYFTIPNGVKSINIYCWGAGGGGSKSYYSGNLSDGGRGGSGSFVMGTLDVSTINKLDIIVGEGGRKGVRAARCGNAFGGGGDAGTIGDNNWASGGGGGLSGVFSSVYMNVKNIETYSTPIIIAGGGGGSGAFNSYYGGNAGGVIGIDGAYLYSSVGGRDNSRGGTQSDGGSGRLSGSKFNGGSCTGYGGGGGSGYFGGGAANVVNSTETAGGAGGSSYIAPNLTNRSIPNASQSGTTTVNGSANKYYKNNAGLGANVGLNNGNDGLVVIEYLLNSNIIYGSGNCGNDIGSSNTNNYRLISATDLNKGTGGNGVNATLTNIAGYNEYYAAGGGGSSYLGPVGLGGIGESGVYLGGNGTNNSSAIKISNAVANTGSGGGGSACDGINPSIGGNGSAGICIIKYSPFIYYPPLTTLNFTSILISQNKYNITINTLNYVVNFSSLSGTNYPYFLLDRSIQSWITATTYNSSGNYIGSAYLADINYRGEWVYYKFPYSIALYSYEIISLSSSGYPLLWKIYGSNDETNWEEITGASNNQIEVDSRSFIKVLNVLPKTYKYIGIVINKVKFLNSENIYLYLTGFFVNGRVHNLTNLYY